MMITSAEEFIRLRDSRDPDDYRRAANEAAPEEVWLVLVRGHPEHRRWVAHNKTVPVSILERLATDKDPEVRWVVASRRKAPPELLRVLANDPDETVRMRVASNANSPRPVLEELATDPSSTVREAACARLASG